MAEYTYRDSSVLSSDEATTNAAAQLSKSLKESSLELQKIRKQLKQKGLSKKKKAKLKARKKNINTVILGIKESLALLPKKQIPTQNVIARPGTAKTVKIPENNIFAVTEQALPTEMMEELFFDSIGATEIINVETHDQIVSNNPKYNLVSDIAALNTEYSVNKIVALQKTASTYFSSFGIDFDSYKPQNGTGPSNEIVYVDATTGDLIVNTLDLPQNFRVEVQVMSFEDILNDTIYI